MSWEQALTPTLEQTLNMILSALANFFGTTTENVMANAPMWLAKYGWYVTLKKELIEWLFGGALVGFLIAGVFLLLWDANKHEIKALQIVIAFTLFIVGTVAIISIPIVTCLIAPEIVGLEAVIKLLK
jgi:uncharacterized membrane protein